MQSASPPPSIASQRAHRPAAPASPGLYYLMVAASKCFQVLSPPSQVTASNQRTSLPSQDHTCPTYHRPMRHGEVLPSRPGPVDSTFSRESAAFCSQLHFPYPPHPPLSSLSSLYTLESAIIRGTKGGTVRRKPLIPSPPSTVFTPDSRIVQI
jgi:hypothetical protein